MIFLEKNLKKIFEKSFRKKFKKNSKKKFKKNLDFFLLLKNLFGARENFFVRCRFGILLFLPHDSVARFPPLDSRTGPARSHVLLMRGMSSYISYFIEPVAFILMLLLNRNILLNQKKTLDIFQKKKVTPGCF